MKAGARYGGDRSLTYFSGLLGFTEQAGFHVRAVRQEAAQFFVSVGSADGEFSAELYIEPVKQGAPSFLRGRHVALSYRGSSIPDALEQTLRKHALANSEDLTIEALQNVLGNDPDTSSVERSSGGITTREHYLDARADAFADFLARQDILCQKVVSMWLFNPCTLILHGDSECFGPPNLGLNMVMVINAPWDNRVRDIGRPRRAAARHSEADPEGLLVHVTDMRENDVISGAVAKERAIFDKVFAKNPGLVVFFHACVGVVGGSDIEGVYKHYKAKHHLPVLYFRGGENQQLKDFYREVFVDDRLEAPRLEQRSPHSVNLLGYTGHQLTDELEAILKRARVHINGVLLPSVNLPGVLLFENALVNVVLPNIDLENFYEQLLQDTSVPTTIRPQPPYGMGGTERWLRTVVQAVGCETSRLDRQIEAIRSERGSNWEASVSRASGHTLAFVVRDDEVEHLLDPGHNYGVPVIPTVVEMGFGVEVLIRTSGEEATRTAEARISEAAGPGANLSFCAFDSADELMQRLEASSAGAVMSNFFFEWRATANGKSVFSVQHFEPGFDGAQRTIDRLIRLCETGLYKKYGHYLRRNALGQRVMRNAAL